MKILLVTGRYPWPPRRGDQLRTVQTLRALAPHHHVTLLAPEPPAGAPPPPPETTPGELALYRPDPRPRLLAAALHALASGKPLQSALYRHRSLLREVARRAPAAELVVAQLVRLLDVAEVVGETPLVFDLVDSLALNFERRATVDHRLLRPFLQLEARRLGAAEAHLAARAAALLVVCERDRRALLQRLGGRPGRVAVCPLEVVPEPPSTTPTRGDHSVVFTGNLGYFPNLDAVRWWATAVWPQLHRDRPQLRFRVAGDRPPARLRRLLRRLPATELRASPADLSAELATAALAIAPLRCGSGVPVKILEAWRAGVPVVASPWAAEGADAVPGEDLLVAATPVEWRAAVTDLLDRPERARELVAAGRRRLAEHHAPEPALERLRGAIEAAVEP